MTDTTEDEREKRRAYMREYMKKYRRRNIEPENEAEQLPADDSPPKDL